MKKTIINTPRGLQGREHAKPVTGHKKTSVGTKKSRRVVRGHKGR